MTTTTIHFVFEIGGNLANATSVVLRAPDGSYGVRRADTLAVVVPSGTPLVQTGLGTYEYTFNDPAPNLFYNYWVEFVWQGQTYRIQQNIAAADQAVRAGMSGGSVGNGGNAGAYQNLIIDSLSNADVLMLASLQKNVPLYWQLHARVAYPELRYWYVRRDAIRLLMGCAHQEVDYVRSLSNANRASVSSSRQDSHSSSSSTMTSASAADRSSSSSYDDATDATGSGSNSAARDSSQSASSSSTMTDIGAGASSGSRVTVAQTLTTDEGSVETVDKDDYDIARHMEQRGYQSMALTQEFPALSFDDVGEHVDLNFDVGPFHVKIPLPVVGAAQDNVSHGFTEQHSHTHDYLQMLGPDESFRRRKSKINVLTTPHHSVVMSATDTGTQDSNFNANMHTSGSGSSSSSMSGSASSSSTFNMTGSGAGSMTATGTSSSSLTASSTRTAHADGEAHMSMQGNAQHNASMQKLHQRFLHLQELWARATQMIEWLEAQRLALTPYVMAQIVTQYPDGCDARVVNALLVQTPYRINSGVTVISR